MVEHSLCMRGARGSIPRISIIVMKNFSFSFVFHFLCVSPFYKKRQRQGSNLRSQREIAQQATALTTRPRCLSDICMETPCNASLSAICENFQKRQWQDLNLRIQRIIDFKSIALDHSATLSVTRTALECLLVDACLSCSRFILLYVRRLYLSFYSSFPFLP